MKKCYIVDTLERSNFDFTIRFLTHRKKTNENLRKNGKSTKKRLWLFFRNSVNNIPRDVTFSLNIYIKCFCTINDECIRNLFSQF